MKILTLALLTITSLLAQDTSVQLRPVGHFKFPIGRGFYAVTWTIGNTMTNKPDNINVFPGLGYGTDTWWLETMVQKQWNRTGGRTFADVRFYTKLPAKMDLYLEAAPAVDGRGLYDFATLQRNVWKGFWAGLETENFHQPGRDVLAGGFRGSYVPPPVNNIQPVIGVAWYPFHHHLVGPGEGKPMGQTVRFYTVLHYKIPSLRKLFH